MKGIFTVRDILGIKFATCFSEDGGHGLWKLQRFLCGNPEWETAKGYNLHIGENGEQTRLRYLLSKEQEVQIDEAMEETAKRFKIIGGASIITPKTYNFFAQEVERRWGINELELELRNY